MLYWIVSAAVFAWFVFGLTNEDRTNRQRARIGLSEITPQSMRVGALLAGGIVLLILVLAVVA